MREIKFRAWDKVEKRFGYVTIHPSQLSWMSPKYSQQNLVMEIDNDISGVEFINIEGWQQFTGLHDKNGKEVFEGDICREKGEPDYIVNFSDGCFRGDDIHNWDIMVDHFPICKSLTEKCEIIGNIYENGDLLK